MPTRCFYQYQSPIHYHKSTFHQYGVKGAKFGYAGTDFSSCVLFRSRISFRLIISRHNRSRKGEVHACCTLVGQNDAEKRTVRRYEDENHITDGEKTMITSLHTQTSASNTATATSVSRWTRQAPQKRNFPKPEPIFIRLLPTSSLPHWK